MLSDVVHVDSVLAAVAYGGSASDITQDLVGNCLTNKLRLDLWMRYDHTVPGLSGAAQAATQASKGRNRSMNPTFIQSA